MAKDPVVFTLVNQILEIFPEEAGPHVTAMATGISDYSNQINNILCFPRFFKGALDCLTKYINEKMKMAAAYAIAYCIEEDHLNRNTLFQACSNPSSWRMLQPQW